MHIHQRDIATAEAEKLVLANIQKVLADTTYPKKLIQDARIPVFGIRWGAAVYRRITRDRLCRILRSIRNSKLDSLTYRRMSLIWRTASEKETDFPDAWAELRATIGRFDLDDETKLSSLVDIIDSFVKQGWGSPSKLALISPTQLRAALDGHRLKKEATQLWTSDTLLFADLSSASFLVLKGASENAEKFIHRLNNASMCNRGFALTFRGQ